jgi:polyisoprenoid-binding protein YceI
MKYLMLKKGLFVFLFLFYQCGFAQYHPVAGESTVRFSLKNFGFKTSGSLDAPEGDIVFNPDDLAKSSFRVRIKAESINTDNESRDEHLKDETYFDVRNYPMIRFVSSSVKVNGKIGSYETTGILTVKNKSKEITMPFTAEKNGSGWTFSCSFKMNRKDYDVGGSSTLSDEVTVEIKVVAR